MNTELRAAYERIEELVTVLRHARAYINRDEDADDMAEVLADIDHALDDELVAS